MSNIKLLPLPTVSPNDKKSYRSIQLNNGLTVLLISDVGAAEAPEQVETDDNQSTSDFSDCSSEDTDGSADSECDEDEDEDDCRFTMQDSAKKLAAAALCVKVGSFSDPDIIPGLAHFLEHMVFMGSEIYPDENQFDKFIQNHGGEDNASTDSELTLFKFEVNPSHFKRALDIWAKFFVCPLMNFSSISREVKAVDCEFKMAVVDEESRQEQLIGHMCRASHPISKFMWGSEKSLKTEPEKNGVNVYEALKTFHKTHYYAANMTLALQSVASLDTLQEWVTTIFQDIPNGRKPEKLVERVPDDLPELASGPFHICHVVPIKNIQELHVLWFLPSMLKNYKTKPLEYVSWLVGHEGQGSLISLLKKQGLAITIDVNDDQSGFDYNSLYSIFALEITLTDKGFAKKEEVLDAVFQYLHLLRVSYPSKQIFDEMCQIRQNSFTYQEESSSLSNVEEAVENMHYFPPEDILTGDTLFFEFHEDIIQSVLDDILPSKAIILLYGLSNHDSSCLQKEPWFGTQYFIKKLDQQWIDRWSDDRKDIDPELHLPRPNKFIPKDFTLVSTEPESAPDAPPKHPELIVDTPACKVWFKTDIKFKLPKGYVQLHLLNPTHFATPEHQAFMRLWISILDYNLSEVMYDANAASYSHEIGASHRGGLQLKVSGYSDKLSVVLETVCESLFNFSVSEDVFEQQRLLLLKDYYNKLLCSDKLCKDLRLTILEQQRYSLVDRYSGSSNLTRAGLMSFVKQYLGGVITDGLVQGNVDKTQALKMIDKFRCGLTSVHQYNHVRNERVLTVPACSPLIKVKALNATDENSMVTMYLQFGPSSIDKCVLVELLRYLMCEPCFDILRTKKQLGYSVYVEDHNTAGVVGLTVNVQTQSSRFAVEKVTEDILEFLDVDFYRLLRDMPPEEFESNVLNLIELKDVEDNQLVEEVERNWDEIVNTELIFNRVQLEIKRLQAVSFAEVVKFYEANCRQTARRLTLQVRGNEMNPTAPTTPLSPVVLPPVQLEMLDSDLDIAEVKGQEIKDITAFKSSCSYYPISFLKI